nr:hypothetical protein [uncultured Mucilaginibacter sp.]
MKLYTALLFLLLFAAACGQPSKTVNVKAPNVALTPGAITREVPVNAPSPQSASKWFDSLSVVYNKATKNELVRQAVDDKAITEEWLFDQEIKTDTANYYVYHVGHDVSDADGTRFITDSWIYVDTLKRKFYEVDVSENKLLEWKP